MDKKGERTMKRIEIPTPRLCLREYELSDLPLHHSLISDAQVMLYIQDVYTRSYEESLQNLQFAMEESKKENRTNYFLVISDRQTRTYMGGIGYEVLSECPRGKQVEIGYFLYPQFQGQGYASEALRALIRFAFEEDGVYRINGTCIVDNIASAHVMESCKMVREGELRKVQWHIDRLRDRYLYRLLKEEWQR